MNIFIENLNVYLSEKKIKNAYISLLTGWDKSKVSRVLNGEVDIKMEDASILASSLGKDISFFLRNKEDIKKEALASESFAFYAGHLDREDQEVAANLLDMFRYYDALVNLEL